MLCIACQGKGGGGGWFLQKSLEGKVAKLHGLGREVSSKLREGKGKEGCCYGWLGLFEAMCIVGEASPSTRQTEVTLDSFARDDIV